VLIILRSIVFNALFYLNLVVLMLAALFTMPFRRRGVLTLAKVWGRVSIWLLRVVAGIGLEWRGLEKIPKGALIVAAKHQSLWETFALLTLFDDPAFIIKRELMWIPLFGWCAWRGEMIPVDRKAGSQAIAIMTEGAKKAIAQERQIIIFPEGTRRAAGAEPRYKIGVAHLYAGTGASCLPVALNSGLFWPRRSFRRFPGTIVVEILDPIPPGLDSETFRARLQEDIESATARLVEQGRRELARAGIAVAAGQASEA
jgi:1-acyl-sn-glycerol-3-phosphate acyltransferase